MRFCSRRELSQGAREQGRRFCSRRELSQGACELGRRFCSRGGLSQGAREQERRFCSRGELSQGAREQERRFCSRGGLSQGACEQERRFCSRRELSQGAREQGRRFCSRRGRQRALSQEIIWEITSGEKVSSMFLYSETSPVTQCWKRWFSHLLRSCPSGNVCTPKCRRRTPIDPLWQRNRTKTLPDSTPPITNITPHRQVQRSVRLNRLFFKDIEKAAGHYGREAFTNIFINNWLHNTPQSVAGGRHYDETSILNIQ